MMHAFQMIAQYYSLQIGCPLLDLNETDDTPKPIISVIANEVIGNNDNDNISPREISTLVALPNLNNLSDVPVPFSENNIILEEAEEVVSPQASLTEDDQKRLTRVITNMNVRRAEYILIDHHANFNSEHWATFFTTLSKLNEKKIWVKERIEEAIQFMEQDMPSLPKGATSRILRVIGHFKITSKDFERHLLSEIRQHYQEYSDPEIYMFCSGLRKLAMISSSPEELQSFLAELSTYWTSTLNNPESRLYSPKAIASMYRLLSELKNFIHHDDTFIYQIGHRITEFTVSDLCEILEGLRNKGHIQRQFLYYLADHIQSLQLGEGRNYTTLLSSLVGANYCDPQWYEMLLREIFSEEKKFDIFQKMLALSAVARSGMNTPLMERLALQVARDPDLRDKCYFEDYTEFVLTFAFLFGNRHQDISHQFIQNALSHDRIDNASKTQLYEAAVLTNFDVRKLPRHDSRPTFTSGFQSLVASHLRDAGIAFREEARIGASPVDILLTDFRINGKQVVIQVDGPYHFTIPNNTSTMSTIINTNILEKLKYHVIRISGEWESQLDQLIKDIKARERRWR